MGITLFLWKPLGKLHFLSANVHEGIVTWLMWLTWIVLSVVACPQSEWQGILKFGPGSHPPRETTNNTVWMSFVHNLLIASISLKLGSQIDYLIRGVISQKNLVIIILEDVKAYDQTLKEGACQSIGSEGLLQRYRRLVCLISSLTCTDWVCPKTANRLTSRCTFSLGSPAQSITNTHWLTPGAMLRTAFSLM